MLVRLCSSLLQLPTNPMTRRSHCMDCRKVGAYSICLFSGNVDPLVQTSRDFLGRLLVIWSCTTNHVRPILSPPTHFYQSNPFSSDFWQYFEPIRKYMPKNCSADVATVISLIDYTIEGGNEDDIASLQETLNLAGIDSPGFASYREFLESLMKNGVD